MKSSPPVGSLCCTWASHVSGTCSGCDLLPWKWEAVHTSMIPAVLCQPLVSWEGNVDLTVWMVEEQNAAAMGCGGWVSITLGDASSTAAECSPCPRGPGCRRDLQAPLPVSLLRYKKGPGGCLEMAFVHPKACVTSATTMVCCSFKSLQTKAAFLLVLHGHRGMGKCGLWLQKWTLPYSEQSSPSNPLTSLMCFKSCSVSIWARSWNWRVFQRVSYPYQNWKIS